jgi:hypothetical protein
LANVPSYNADNISLGPAIIYVGLVGSTPTIDVGAVAEDGMEFSVAREFLEVNQGSPKVLIKQFVTGETVELTCNTIEWNLTNLTYALGTGVTTSTASVDTYAFGADPATTEVAVHVRHSLPSGHTISIYMWRAQPTGEWNMNMAQDELHTFPFSFKALQATTAWDGSALPVGQQLFKVTRFKA